MTLDEALIWADKFNQSMTPTTSTVTAITLAAEVRRLQAEVMNWAGLFHTEREQCDALIAENTALRLYAPARRAQPTIKTAPIAPTNWPAWGMIDETDEEFAARAGRKITEVAG